MELELQWDGNPSIILDIRTRLGVSLPIQVIEQIVVAQDVAFHWFSVLLFLKDKHCSILHPMKLILLTQHVVSLILWFVVSSR